MHYSCLDYFASDPSEASESVIIVICKCLFLEYRWNEKTDSREIRAVSKIQPGDEITVNYAMNHSMANLASRQEKLLNWGFICWCERCLEEKFNDSDVELYKRFDNFKMEAKKLKNQCYRRS